MKDAGEALLVNALTGNGRSGRPKHFGTRFDDTGRFLREPGNTVVAHLVPGSKTEAVLIEVRERMMALPHAHHFAFTPVSSLHMTLIQGVLDNRRKQHYWPEGVALDTPVDDVTRIYLDRLADFEHRGPFTMAPRALAPTGLIVAGAIPEDERRLRVWRVDLTARFGYRHPDHDDYVFHITLAYLVDWLSEAAVEPYEIALQECFERIVTEAPEIELDDMAFCSFVDMNHFEPLHFLRAQQSGD